MKVVPLMKATPKMIMIARGLMTNIERQEQPLSKEYATMLFLSDEVPVDTRRLAVHRLLDLAIEAKDAQGIHEVAKELEQAGNPVTAYGLVLRLTRQDLDHGWKRWAWWWINQQRKGQKPAEERLVA